MREKIFVSYSHKDAAWLKLLEEKSGTGIYAEAFKLCSDKDIKPGQQWKREITAAIASSRIALLLVSRDFLRSDFIVKDEIAKILRRNASHRPGQPETLSVWWVPLDEISDEELRQAGLDGIQAAVGSPSKPLIRLGKKERADAIGTLAAKLLDQLKSLSNINSADRDEFRGEVARVLASVNTELKEALAPGDYSIIYRAERLGAEVSVKALVPSPRREWLGTGFIERANSARKVLNDAAIGIRDVHDDKEIKCVVMEFVRTPTLKAPTKQSDGCLPCVQVADVLAQLAGVAAELHLIDGQPILGPVRPSHVHYDPVARKARISLIHITNEKIRSSLQRPTDLLDSDALTYLSPERYFGRKPAPSADQYYLGLLGLELLQGKPPVEVSSFADLEIKRRFFDLPRDLFGDLPTRHPEMSYILTRMLEKDPQDRWGSMSELAEALRQTAGGNVPKAVKKHAADNYTSKIKGNDKFFALFYQALFSSSDEIRVIFTQRGVTMDEQYKKLGVALASLFSFDRSIEPTTLDGHAETHQEIGLKAEHFELFRAAFLGALRETMITDFYSQDAWRAILDPALAFMSEKAARKTGSS